MNNSRAANLTLDSSAKLERDEVNKLKFGKQVVVVVVAAALVVDTCSV